LCPSRHPKKSETEPSQQVANGKANKEQLTEGPAI
jgi:hypothetical protein